MTFGIEELISPLQDLFFDGNEPATLLSNLLLKLEATPLKYNDRLYLEQHIDRFITKYKLRETSDIGKNFAMRTSFNFCPGINKFKIIDMYCNNMYEPTSSKVLVNKLSLDLKNNKDYFEDYEGLQYTSPLEVYIIQRNQSTLWTSYSLCRNESSIENNASHNQIPRLNDYYLPKKRTKIILIARKLKIDQKYSIWTYHSDSRNWKDKNDIIGVLMKFSRSNNANNSNSHNSSRITHAAMYTAKCSNDTGNNSLSEGLRISVKINADRHINIKAMIPAVEDITEGDGDHLNGFGFDAMYAARVIPVAEVAAQSRTPLTMLRSQLWHDGTPQMQNTTLQSPSGPNAPHARSPAAAAPAGGYLRSRKNIVVDCALAANQRLFRQSGLGYSSCPPAPPVFQLGKVSHDQFALTFHTLSIFQAFALALAVFDQ